MSKSEKPLKKDQADREAHLRVYSDRSVLVDSKGEKKIFIEGDSTEGAEKRLRQIKEALQKGFLEAQIEACKKPEKDSGKLDEESEKLFTALVDSVTSEVGRAVVGLTILQLCIKAICPEQCIRLHKGGGGRGGFSWAEGVPMRTIDKTYITPVLRRYGLLRLNADGFMMTRSLAENYPYSYLYKAAIRGAKDVWVIIIELIEEGKIEADVGLRRMLALLQNRSDNFKKLANETIKNIKKLTKKKLTIDGTIKFFSDFVKESSYSARIFEVALHSLFQVFEDTGAFEGSLKPLSQMRSANKKHGNVGDIEITALGSSLEILEAWDAKYGKAYLRDELEELNDKLKDHSETKVAGFVTDTAPNVKDEIIKRAKEIEDIHSVKIIILEFSDWVKDQARRARIDEGKAASEWLIAFTESLCQMRRERAPIDEPCDIWVKELNEFTKKIL